MLNQQNYEEDFKKLGLTEKEKQAVLDYFCRLGQIIINYKYKKNDKN